MGDGQVFKGKLIGVLEVPEARGDRMCQNAIQELKMAIRASGEHKQRVIMWKKGNRFPSDGSTLPARQKGTG